MSAPNGARVARTIPSTYASADPALTSRRSECGRQMFACACAVQHIPQMHFRLALDKPNARALAVAIRCTSERHFRRAARRSFNSMRRHTPCYRCLVVSVIEKIQMSCAFQPHEDPGKSVRSHQPIEPGRNLTEYRCVTPHRMNANELCRERRVARNARLKARPTCRRVGTQNAISNGFSRQILMARDMHN